jgi:NB-ARC domain/Rx N-terminal domain
MARAMGSWVLAHATDKLSSLFSSVPSASAFSSSTGLSSDPTLEDLKKLHRTMKRIRAILRDADEREITSLAQRLRLSELTEVAYDAEDVIDEYQYEVLRSHLQSDVSSLKESNQVKFWEFIFLFPFFHSFENLYLLQTSDLVPVRVRTVSMSHCIKRKRPSGKEASELCLSSITVPVPVNLAVRVKIIRKKFEEIIDGWRDLNLKASDGKKTPNRNKLKRRLMTSLVDEPTIHGRENEKEEIVQLLLHSDAYRSDNVISVLVITGLSGVGKTTVAQLAYNDPRVGQFFELMAWVSVPMNFDVEKLTRHILESFTNKKWDPVGLNNLQRRLMEEVKGKRFLLVLDDVWNEREDPWSKLRLPLNHARYGLVLVTTRNENVARLMRTIPSYPLSILPFDNCWSLFKQIVFGHQGLEKYANLLVIGEKIVKKCGGLPLAIKALGNALRITNNDDEPDEESWQDVLNSELWEITQGEMEVLPALKLSYDQMPSEIKQCFLIFSLFPKDFIFVRENIVKLWISLGFIRLDGKKLAEDIGSSYFDNLVQRSMIQKNYYDQRVDGFFMHDLIQDLAQFMASKYFSRKEFEELEGLPFEVRFLSIVVNKLPQQINLDLFCHPRKLKILQIVSAVKKFNNDISIEMHDELFKNLKHLRALDFSHTNIQSLPDSIGNLKQL